MHAIMCYIDIVNSYSYSMTWCSISTPLMLSVLTLSNYWDQAQPPAVRNISIEQTCNIWVAAAEQWTVRTCRTAAQIPALLGLEWKGADIQIFFQYSDWIFLFDVRIMSSEVNYVTRGHPNLWFMNIRKAALYSALHSHARAQSCCPAPAAARPVCKVILASNLHNMRLPAQCCHDH